MRRDNVFCHTSIDTISYNEQLQRSGDTFAC
jgi:hypothetical protein